MFTKQNDPIQKYDKWTAGGGRTSLFIYDMYNNNITIVMEDNAMSRSANELRRGWLPDVSSNKSMANEVALGRAANSFFPNDIGIAPPTMSVIRIRSYQAPWGY